MQASREIKKPALKLALLCMAFYSVSYLCRKSFDSNINEIMDFYGQGKGAVGLIGTLYFIAYAVGQVFHGLMCKRYNARRMLAVGGIAVAVLNVSMGLIPVAGFDWMKFIWLLNGFINAAFWSLLILTLNRSVAKKHKPTVMLLTCFPVAVGTLLAYSCNAFLSYLRHFQWSFYIAGGAMLLAVAWWLLRSGKLIEASLEEKAREDAAEESNAVAAGTETPGSEDANKTSSKLSRSFLIMFAMMAVFAVINNLVKDGLNTWTPSVLREQYGLQNWMSVLLSVGLPLASAFCGFPAVALYKNSKDSVWLCGWLYLTVGAALAGMLLLFGGNGGWLVPLILMIFSSFVLYIINSVITSFFPLDQENANAGTVAGVLDGFCYLGSALSSYGLGSLAEKSGGWTTVFHLLAVVCVFCTVAAAVYLIILRAKAKS